MTAVDRQQYSSYSAPLQHGEKLLTPDLDSVQRWLLDAPSPLPESESSVSIGDVALSTLRDSARHNLLQLAKRYTASYRDLPELPVESKPRIVMGGHQPDLFHCGVWFKNFLLSKLGKSTGSIPIHFIVDNDLCRRTGIHVPHIHAGQVANRWIDLDSPGQSMPWENRQLQDHGTWSSFPFRVRQACAKLKGDPLLEGLWQHAGRLDSTAPLGCLLSQARHLVEMDFGLQTLELPLSQLVSTIEFAQFSWHLLSELAHFHQVYNAELDRYRLAHRIRNHAQPLPNLAAADNWLEAPFWCYTSQSTAREPLWVQRQSGRMLLSDRKGWECSFEATSYGSAIEQWLQLHSQGMRIRPRALITTMYARLILCDLFIHGIGGGKYDQITDRIARSFFQITLPPYAVASATMRLQFDNLPADLLQSHTGQLQKTQQDINAVEANPEMLLQMSIPSLSAEQRHELQAAAERKRQLLAEIPSKGEKWEWHLTMKKVKQQLAELAQPHLRQLQAEFDRLQSVARQQDILNSREYSFCLFSVEEIQKHFA
jgi:hypothetical protein